MTVETWRVDEAVALAEGALYGTDRKRGIWTDADYLTAILALLTEDADRAREASLAEFRRRTPEVLDGPRRCPWRP